MKSLKALYLKCRQQLIIGLSIVLIAVAVTNIYFVLEVRVTSNDECLWIPKKITKDSTAIFFDIVKIDGVTWEAGIRNGDQLIAINGETLHSTLQAQLILNKVASGDYADYVVMKDGKVFETKVRVKKLIQYGNLANSLSALFWMLIGFIVLTAKPDGRIQKLFYAIGAFAVLASMNVLIQSFEFFGFVRENPLLVLIINILWISGLSFLPFILLYFFWNFPQPFKFAQKKWLKRLMFIAPAIIAVVSIVNINQAVNYPRVNLSAFLINLYFLLGLLIITNLASFIFLIIQ